MQVEELVVAKEKATEELASLKALFKKNAQTKKEGIYRDLRSAYGHMKLGKSIIDVPESIKKAGLNAEGLPRLAIVRADSKMVRFQPRWDGSAVFQHLRNGDPNFNRAWRYRSDKDDIQLNVGSFTWHRDPKTNNAIYNRATAPTSLIPPKIAVDEVKYALPNYFVLWEVEKWTEIPKDPMLLKRITSNLYGVLATWDLTELERAVIKGRLA